ncbi:acyl-CoA synthetase [Paenibacillus sp. JDR-2]|uniref:acyl-CoA synthetase n=1 Tax=Paenibacillus sp. (strain JDR-2) TaxID=324057 RepID=UPI0001668D96|nr:acyl--CoA ligase [Paenibacillus sp. JDR-2]ACT03287.1 AMP-dependent synthetase and ligase [Paenibacillus sp. JDR-2]
MNFDQWIAPEQYNISSEIERHKSDKLALRLLDDQGHTTHITYNDLLNQVNQLAGGLNELGLAKGDRVLVMVPRTIEAYMIYVACLKLGLVIIPSSEMLRAKDLSYRLQHSEARAVIAWAEGAAEVDNITEELPELQFRIDASGGQADGWITLGSLMEGQPEEREAEATHRDDMAILAYTSGTTGNPKGVVHSHGWGYAHLRITAAWLGIQSSDLVWATAAPGWQKWIWTPFLSVLGSGATGLIYNGSFSAERYLRIIQENQVQVMCCTPTEYRIMAKTDGLSGYDLSSIRSAVSAGEPLNQAVIKQFEELFGFIIRDGYGQTENTLLIGNLKDSPIKIGSMGKSIVPGLVEIIDDEGRPQPMGEVGSIAVHTDMPALFKSYYKDPDRKGDNIVGSYFITGDRASKDEEGYLWFEGRGDDIIISSGYTIGPFEVEEALLRHPSVKECAAVASPDEIRGHIVKAFIVLRDGVSGSPELVQELQDHVKSVTAPYKYPRKIEFVSELPKTNSGKIRRIELRQREAFLNS